MKKGKSVPVKKKKIKEVLKPKPVSKKPKSKNIVTKLKYQVIGLILILLAYFSGFT